MIQILCYWSCFQIERCCAWFYMVIYENWRSLTCSNDPWHGIACIIFMLRFCHLVEGTFPPSPVTSAVNGLKSPLGLKVALILIAICITFSVVILTVLVACHAANTETPQKHHTKTGRNGFISEHRSQTIEIVPGCWSQHGKESQGVEPKPLTKTKGADAKLVSGHWVLRPKLKWWGRPTEVMPTWWGSSWVLKPI